MPLPPRLAGLPGRELPAGQRLACAVTARARLAGLAGLDALADGAGLHLPATRSVHTLGMRFALDLLWLDGAGAVVRIDRAVPPRRLRACRRARSVIEVGAGGADAMRAALEALSPPQRP